MNGRESAMATVITCHNYKKLRHKKEDCNQLNERLDKLRNLENSKTKWCTYHQNNGYLSEECYQQQSETKKSPEFWHMNRKK